jgi:hypothetical protein
MAAHTLDHNLILISYSELPNEPRSFSRSFTFEASWQLDSECHDIIQEEWEQEVNEACRIKDIQSSFPNVKGLSHIGVNISLEKLQNY